VPRRAYNCRMRVRDVMTDEVTTVEETATVGDALKLLQELEIRHLPVTRSGEVVGMLSDRDFRSLGLTLITDLERLDRLQAVLEAPVSGLMSGDVIRVNPESDLREVVDLMVDEKIGAVPVVDPDTGDLDGIVSYVDALKGMRELLEPE